MKTATPPSGLFVCKIGDECKGITLVSGCESSQPGVCWRCYRKDHPEPKQEHVVPKRRLLVLAGALLLGACVEDGLRCVRGHDEIANPDSAWNAKYFVCDEYEQR
jgi:hypothetical protein